MPKGSTSRAALAYQQSIYDDLGRLKKETTYEYAEADRLVKVCNTAGGATCGQERFFTYDNRGFLTSEQHPEIGLIGNGQTLYSYDASEKNQATWRTGCLPEARCDVARSAC